MLQHLQISRLGLLVTPPTREGEGGMQMLSCYCCRWMDCSVVVNYSNNDLLASALFLYKDFLTLQTGLEILVYSGDVDGVVAHPGMVVVVEGVAMLIWAWVWA